MRLSVVCLVAWLGALAVGFTAEGIYMSLTHLAFLSFLGAFAAGASFVGPALLLVTERLGDLTFATGAAVLLAGLGVGSTLAVLLLFVLHQPLLPVSDISQALYAMCVTFGVTFAGGLLVTSRRRAV